MTRIYYRTTYHPYWRWWNTYDTIAQAKDAIARILAMPGGEYKAD